MGCLAKAPAGHDPPAFVEQVEQQRPPCTRVGDAPRLDLVGQGGKVEGAGARQDIGRRHPAGKATGEVAERARQRKTARQPGQPADPPAAAHVGVEAFQHAGIGKGRGQGVIVPRAHVGDEDLGLAHWCRFLLTRWRTAVIAPMP